MATDDSGQPPALSISWIVLFVPEGLLKKINVRIMIQKPKENSNVCFIWLLINFPIIFRMARRQRAHCLRTHLAHFRNDTQKHTPAFAVPDSAAKVSSPLSVGSFRAGLSR